MTTIKQANTKQNKARAVCITNPKTTGYIFFQNMMLFSGIVPYNSNICVWTYKSLGYITFTIYHLYHRNPVLDAIRTLGTSNRAIYCNLQNICFSVLIDLDTLIIISPKIDAPYLWIRPLGLVPLNLAYRLLWIIMDRLYIPVITLHLSIVAKKKPIQLQRSHNYGVWNYW